jgi:hypothetical protein
LNIPPTTYLPKYSIYSAGANLEGYSLLGVGMVLSP